MIILLQFRQRTLSEGWFVYSVLSKSFGKAAFQVSVKVPGDPVNATYRYVSPIQDTITALVTLSTGRQNLRLQKNLVRLKSYPLSAFTFRAQRGSDSKIAWNRGVGVQQKCCAPKSLNCWMSLTNLHTCYTSLESWGLSELNGVCIISFGAPERKSWII